MTRLIARPEPRRVAASPALARGAETGTARRWLLMVLLSLAQFMVILDVTVVNVALPAIGRSLALDQEMLTWVATSYTVAFGGLLVLGGRLADAVGRRYVFLIGLAIFAGASLLVAMAPNGGILIASRVVQGVGAAMLSPAALSILTTELTGPHRSRALAVWAAIGGAGAAVGVLVGGALASGPGWYWAFLVHVPVGIVVAVGVAAVVPFRVPQSSSRIDFPGALTLTAATSLLIYGIINSGDSGWTSISTLPPLAAAVLVAVAFVLLQRASVTPLVPFAMLRRPPLPGALITMLGASGLLFSAFFLNSIYLQQARQFSAMETGWTFLPVAVGTVVGAQVGAHLMAHAGPRAVAVAGLVIAAVSLGILGWQGTGGGVMTTLMPTLVVASAGVGATFVAATTSAMTAADHEAAGVASGLLNTGHELGGALGIALVSAIIAPALAGLTINPGQEFQDANLTSALGAAVFAGLAAALLPGGRATGSDRPKFMH